jgi:hypothetical protein
MFSILVTSANAAGGLVELPHELTIAPATPARLERTA